MLCFTKTGISAIPALHSHRALLPPSPATSPHVVLGERVPIAKVLRTSIRAPVLVFVVVCKVAKSHGQTGVSGGGGRINYWGTWLGKGSPYTRILPRASRLLACLLATCLRGARNYLEWEGDF